jgi:hypothetical protein
MIKRKIYVNFYKFIKIFYSFIFLAKLEELLDEETNLQIGNKKRLISNENQIMTTKEEIDEHQNRTNHYLAAWCVGSVLLFTLMILLKYVINKSHADSGQPIANLSFLN